MKNLLAFITKHHFIFVFILLQLICFWLMVRQNNYQGSRVLNSSNAVVGSVYQVAANTREYFSLKQENDMLAAENAALRNFLRNNYNIVPLKRKYVKDTIYDQLYSYISANVVNVSVNKRRNFITLNVGSNQGIGRDMGVMCSDGIIGYISAVSGNFSSAMSLLHKDAKVNCQLKKDASYGPLIWDGKDYQYCLLTDIPTHVRLKKGDTVITSELSGIFPEGLFVGTVESWEQRQNESFFTVKVKLGADLKKVHHVYVISNRLKAERDSLEKEAQKQIDD
jgi:rod shape-determining protein MreC